MRTKVLPIAALAVLITVTFDASPVLAQGPREPPPGPPRTAKVAAPVDLTGYWVALVTEDWRYRMVLPPKGDYSGVPMNAESRKRADGWDPAKDEAAGEQCRGFGAAGIMRIPARLHITWSDDETLKVDFDAGTQTRLFHFKPSDSQGGDWQGVSQAEWDRQPTAMGFGRGGPPPGGAMKVVTTKMKAGYLRRNGVPYGENALLTEYWDRLEVPGGQTLLVVASEVVDPAYLATPYWTSIHFRKQPDASGWNPTPCSSR